VAHALVQGYIFTAAFTLGGFALNAGIVSGGLKDDPSGDASRILYDHLDEGPKV
jgi:nitrogen fixation-related uncharacterized protein